MNVHTTVVETNVGIGADVVMIIWPCWLFVTEFGDKIDWAVPTPYEIGVATAVPIVLDKCKYKDHSLFAKYKFNTTLYA